MCLRESQEEYKYIEVLNYDAVLRQKVVVPPHKVEEVQLPHKVEEVVVPPHKGLSATTHVCTLRYRASG